MRTTSRDLAELRLMAEATLRAEDWPGLLALERRLETEDPEWWPHLWAPAMALAIHESGGDPVPALERAVEIGFRQPELLELEQRLGQLPSWPDLAARMSAPALPPHVEVTRWPVASYGPPLVLDRLPEEREAQLRERLPAPRSGAWETTAMLLEWVTTCWAHANDHVESADAIEVLDRVAAGERFACVEYSVVLSQALGALGIPARRVSLRTRDQHVGAGRGHVVSEAWIDDLGRWVVLDGQNGAWWGTDEDPLGLRDLQELCRAGAPRPAMRPTARELSDDDQDGWWRYFYDASSSGLQWAGSLVPVFQGEPSPARLVVPLDAATHPDLSELETGVVDVGGPALTFRPVHPFATGTMVSETVLTPGEAFDLEALPVGEHDLTVRTRTPYGSLAGHPLRIVRR